MEGLHPVVVPVGHVDRALVVHRHIGRAIELSRAVARGAELHQEPAVGGELLDAIIAPVGNVDVAHPGIRLDAEGHVELAGAVAQARPTFRCTRRRR